MTRDDVFPLLSAHVVMMDGVFLVIDALETKGRANPLPTNGKIGKGRGGLGFERGQD